MHIFSRDEMFLLFGIVVCDSQTLWKFSKLWLFGLELLHGRQLMQYIFLWCSGQHFHGHSQMCWIFH